MKGIDLQQSTLLGNSRAIKTKRRFYKFPERESERECVTGNAGSYKMTYSENSKEHFTYNKPLDKLLIKERRKGWKRDKGK